MGTKRKAVVNAEAEQLAEIDRLIRQGFYKTLSEFVREAVAEKLRQIRRDRLADQLERYCEAGYAEEDADLVRAQAFGSSRKHAKR